MNDNDRIPFDDEFIRKRLKEKKKSLSMIYVFAAIYLAVALGMVPFIVFYNQIFDSPKQILFIAYVVFVIIFGGVCVIYQIVNYRKYANKYKVSKGDFIVVNDTIRHMEVTETFSSKGRRNVEYKLSLEHHDEFVTYNYELVGMYVEDNEKCYVVSFEKSQNIPALVFNARIYEYKGDKLKK
jgi:hypothetical protein